jgi:PAS domain S-box-containing protein
MRAPILLGGAPAMVVSDRPLTHLPAILERSPLILFACDPAGVCTFAAGKGLESLGLDPAFLVGQDLLQVFAANAAQTAELDNLLPSIWDPSRHVSGQVDFAGRQISFSRLPLHDDAGRLLGVVGVAFEVADRVRTVPGAPDLDERFRTLFNGAPMGMAIIDASARCLQVNQALCAMLGSSPAELLGGLPADRRLPIDWLTAVPDRDRSLEMRLSRSDGSVVHALVDATALHRGPEGEVTHSVLHLQDITARREMEDAVRRSESWLRTVLSSAPVGILATDGEGVITLAEGRVMDRCHLRQLIGLSARQTLSDYPTLLDGISAALSGRTHLARVECCGAVLDAHVSPLEEMTGGTGGVIAVLTDVTHAVRAERARKEAEARLLKVVNSAPIAVFVFDAHGVVTMAAGRCLSYLGMAADRLVGRSVLSAELAHLDLADRVRVALVGDEVRAVVIGAEHAFDVWFGPIHDDGMVVGGFGIANDITDLYRADQDRRRLLRHVVTAQESERTRIAYDVHDDSLQALTAIGIRLQQLRRRLTSSRDLELVTCIDATLSDAMGRLRALLRELGPPKLEGAGLVAAIVDHARWVLDGTGCELAVEDELTIEPNPECAIVVYRVAQEAVANIRKHASASRVVIRLHSIDDGVLSSVEDDGVGFCVAHVRMNYQPDHLGMTSMRERAEIAGGWISLDSQPGCGTSVRYWIPCHPIANGGDA